MAGAPATPRVYKFASLQNRRGARRRARETMQTEQTHLWCQATGCKDAGKHGRVPVAAICQALAEHALVLTGARRLCSDCKLVVCDMCAAGHGATQCARPSAR